MISKQEVILVLFLLWMVSFITINFMLLMRIFFSLLKELCCFRWTSAINNKLQSLPKLVIVFLHFNESLLQLFIKMHNFINTSTVNCIIERLIFVWEEIELLYLILFIVVKSFWTDGVWTHHIVDLSTIESNIIWHILIDSVTLRTYDLASK
jgi:hypothetical protein